MIELIEIVAELLDIDQNEVSQNFIFREHSQWDSLAALGLITSIEDRFGVVLGDSDLRKVATVGELGELIAKRSTKG
jgi:acyl carrier protein